MQILLWATVVLLAIAGFVGITSWWKEEFGSNAKDPKAEKNSPQNKSSKERA